MPSQTYVVARKVVDRGLSQHSIVLELTLAQRRSIGSDNDQLGLTRAQSLHTRSSAQCDFTGLHHQGELGVDLDYLLAFDVME